MEKLKAKLKKQGGFTLVEMLIVVAIIAILIAVSIPLFNSTLEKARHGVDQANVRDVYSLATAEFLSSPDPTEFDGTGKSYIYYVDKNTHQGQLILTTEVGTDPNKKTGVKPQCTCKDSPKDAQLGVTIKTGTGGGPDITLTGWTYDATANQSKAVP